LDIDFDGAIPASLQGQASTSSGLDDLVSEGRPNTGGPGPSNTMDDLMGIFGSQDPAPSNGGDDLMNGFGGLNVGEASSSQAAASKRTNEDILGLF
jgi:AP-1 complex subunit beta-1